MKTSLRWIGVSFTVAGVLLLPAVPALGATADLSVSMVDSPDPVVAESNITYTILSPTPDPMLRRTPPFRTRHLRTQGSSR